MIHFHKRNHRIGLDVDEVCASFLAHYSEYMNVDFTTAKHFYFSYQTNGILDNLPASFWLGIKPKIDPSKLTFLPAAYVSSRTFDASITEQWLEANGFPCMPVVHSNNMSKVDACKSLDLGIFVDDFILNFNQLSAGGIHTLLMDCNHNRQYAVDPYRIMDLNDVPEKIVELGF